MDGQEARAANSSLVRIANCRRVISEWKKGNISNSEKKIRRLRDDLEDEEEEKYPCFIRLYRIKKKLAIALREEEEFWRQKCRHK